MHLQKANCAEQKKQFFALFPVDSFAIIKAFEEVVT